MTDDAPRLEDTPVGVMCLYCREVIADGDRGFVMPYVGDGADVRGCVVTLVRGAAGTGDTGPVAVVEHRECLAAQTVGHTVGVCSCTGWVVGSRVTAIEVQRRIDEHLIAHN